MATTLDDFVRVLGMVPYSEPITRPLRLLEEAEQRTWRVWASMQILAPTGAITAADVARWEALRNNLYQAELRIRSDMLNAAGPLRSVIEERVPAPTILPAYTGPVRASSGDPMEQPPERVELYGAIFANAAVAAAPAAPAVVAGATWPVWAGLAIAALLIIGGTVYLIASTAEAMGATLMTWRHATHEERWWDSRTVFVLECMRLYPNDEAARTRCIQGTSPPRPDPPRNPFDTPPSPNAPGWLPWTVAGLFVGVVGVGLAAWGWGHGKLPGVAGIHPIELDVRSPGTPEMR